MKTAEEIIASHVERWKDTEGLEETTLIHLSILRDILRGISAEKSNALGNARKDEAQAFRAWEKRIEELRNSSPLSGDLMELLLNPSLTKKRTRLIPDALFSYIPREKLDSYDRSWETAISAEAAAQGWCFWSVDTRVEIEHADAWGRHLADALLPHGVLLFSETQPDASSNSWHGVWYVVLKSRYSTPEFGASEFPGTAKEPSPPQWRLLFSPKRR